MPDEEITSPDGWTKSPFHELANFETGRTPARAEASYWANQSSDGTPWASIADMRPYGVLTETAEKVSPKAVREVFRNRVSKKGTLLMSFKLTIGRVATLGIDACHNEAIISIFPNNRVNQKFLEFFLSQVDYADYQDRAVKGNTLNQEKINRIAVVEPPKPEQEKIAAVLWKVQRAIAVEEKLVSVARELKQSAMRQLFTRGIRNEPQKDTEIGPVPSSWQLKSFDEFATLQRGQDLLKSDFCGGKIPVIGATRVIGYHNAANVKGPGVTVVRSGSSAGRPLYIEQDFWAHNVVLYVKNFHGNLPLFVYYKLCTLDLHQFRSGVAVPTLNRNTFSAETVAVPLLDEQKEIAGILQTLDRKIAVHERKRATLQDLFQTLLHQLMTAQIRVNHLDIDTREVASASPHGDPSLEPATP